MSNQFGTILPFTPIINESNTNATTPSRRARTLRHLALALLVSVGMMLASVWAAADSVDNRPIIVFRADDSRYSWHNTYNGLGGTTGLQYGKQLRIPVTWGVITDAASTSSLSLRWSELRDYLTTAGGEIASHSCKHTPMATTQDYIAEVAFSKSAIERNIPGYTCTSFIQPGTWTDDANMDSFSKLDNPIGKAIQANYVQSMSYLGVGWRIGGNYYKYGMTVNYGIDYSAHPVLQSMNALLDMVAATPGMVFVVFAHGVQETGGTDPNDIQADVLKAFMDKLAQLRNDGKVRLMGLNDAYHASFSNDLNHIPDPGFELTGSSALNGIGPWQLVGNTTIQNSGGVDNSSFAAISDTTADAKCQPLILSPGRYELSWYQKVVQIMPGVITSKPLYVTLLNFGPPDISFGCKTVAASPYSNTNPNEWERKSAIIVIKETLPSAILHFVPGAGMVYGVDNVSLVSAPEDPVTSPSGVTATPSPTQCKLTWKTPADPAATSICIRYGSYTFPLTPTSGTAVASVPATPDTQQDFTMQINWTNRDYVFYSIFAMKSDGSYSAPGVVQVAVDRNPPIPQVSVVPSVDGTVRASWNAVASSYLYAVGNTPGKDDVLHWRQTTDRYVTISGLAAARRMFFSVESRNQFGYTSAPASAPFEIPADICAVFGFPDGSTVNVAGTISAVFSDCCYIEESNRGRGIKLTGNISGLVEGSAVVLTGTLTTNKGERTVVIPSVPKSPE